MLVVEDQFFDRIVQFGGWQIIHLREDVEVDMVSASGMDGPASHPVSSGKKEVLKIFALARIPQIPSST